MQNSTTAMIATTTASTSISISILWDNPIFIALAIISGAIGAWNAFVFINKNKINIKSIEAIDIIANSTFIGAIFAPIVNITLILFGDWLFKEKLGIEFTDTQHIFLYALYWLISLFSGRKLGEYAMDRLGDLRKKEESENE